MGYLYDKYNFVMKNNKENMSRFSQSYKTVTWLIFKKLTEPFPWINIITPLNKLWASLQTSCFNNRKKVLNGLENINSNAQKTEIEIHRFISSFMRQTRWVKYNIFSCCFYTNEIRWRQRIAIKSFVLGIRK